MKENDLLYPGGYIHLSEDGLDVNGSPICIEAFETIRTLRDRVANLKEILQSIKKNLQNFEEKERQ